MFIFTSSNSKLGADLHPIDKDEVLRSFVHRFTGEHKPQWATGTMPDGKPYPVQFRDDTDWLMHTRFAVTKRGRLNHNVHQCESTPTWPYNPELRNGQSHSTRLPDQASR